jgi:type IV fimbrial biogenesis protein FimT
MLGAAQGRIVLMHPAQRGFSLIELAIAIAIMAILIMLGMPSFSEYMANARLGATAQSFYTGLNIARSEAIRRNSTVEFAMTNTPLGPGVENALAPDVTGRNWVVRARPNASSPYDSPPIDSKTALEGGGMPPRVTVNATAAIVTFDGLGTATSAGGAVNTISIDNPPAGLCAPAGPVRCWDVRVSPGGQVQLCDRAAVLGDSRACAP